MMKYDQVLVKLWELYSEKEGVLYFKRTEDLLYRYRYNTNTGVWQCKDLKGFWVVTTEKNIPDTLLDYSR